MIAAHGGAGAVVWSVGLEERWTGAVCLARWGWRARGWCRRGCWNGEGGGAGGGGAIAGGAGAGGTGRVAGWGESERERERERKVESEREKVHPVRALVMLEQQFYQSCILQTQY